MHRVSQRDAQETSVTIDLFCSAACCLLGASEGAEAAQLLRTLESQEDPVLGNLAFDTCYCKLCKASLAIVAYQVGSWTNTQHLFSSK